MVLSLTVMTDAEFNAIFGITPDLPAQELFSLWSDRGQLAVPTARGPTSVGFGTEVSAALSAYRRWRDSNPCLARSNP